MQKRVVCSWVGDKVHDASEKLAREPLPQVRIGKPDYDENGKLVNPRVDGLSLIRALDGLTRDEANEATRAGFLNDLLCCLAARRGFVLVDRVVPTDGLTPEVAARELPPEDLAFLWLTAETLSPFSKSFNSEQKVCLRLGSEDELDPEDMVLYRWVPGDGIYLGCLSFDRLVPLDELTLEQAFHTGHFMDSSENLGAEEYFIEETNRVNMAVDVIEVTEKF